MEHRFLEELNTLRDVVDGLFFPRLRFCKQPARTRVHLTILVHIPLAQATFRLLEPTRTLSSPKPTSITSPLVQPQYGRCHLVIFPAVGNST